MGRVTQHKIKKLQEALLSWFLVNGRKFPWRVKELSHYQLVIAEVLLQRTKAETVARFYPGFISDFPGWDSLAEASIDKLEESLGPVGLQKQRANRLQNLALEMSKRKGVFPKEREEMESIPLLGQYLCNAVELLIFGKSRPLIDVNMARVLERYFGERKMADLRYDQYLQSLANKVVDHPDAKIINWSILDFAALTCKPRNPDCVTCELKTHCLYYNRFVKLSKKFHTERVHGGLTYIDLFAGCGGLSLGLYNAGWRGLFAIEKNYDAFETLRYNLIHKKSHFDWPGWLPQTNLEINRVLIDYKENLKALRGKVDLVAGGPPCQGFSTAGRRKEDDTRNSLIRSYLRFIMYVRPGLIFFENVKGFTLQFKKNKSKGIAYSQYVLRALSFFGYKVEGRMIDFSKYGLPQKRTRFILVGIRKDVAAKQGIDAKDFFRQITGNKKHFLSNKNLPQTPYLGSAISDLLKKNGLVDTPDRNNFKSGLYSNPRSKYQKYLRQGIGQKAIPDSHSFPNHTYLIQKRFKRFLALQRNRIQINKTKEKLNINKHTIIPLTANLPAPTITTLPDDYIHYCEPRILTVRELARIQTFPDWFEFKGKYTTGGKLRTREVPRYTQVGNAIPPLFGEQSGIILKKIYKTG